MARAPPLPSRDRIARAGLCIGCGACAEPGRMAWDRYGQLEPSGPDPWRRARDPKFARICPFSLHARDEDVIAAELFPAAPHIDDRIGRYQAAYVGHAAEEDFRANGSSGGMVSWVATELLRRGLVDGVAHVAPQSPREGDGRLFAYRIARSFDALHEGAKSRYYPVELSGVLDEIRHIPGRYAVIGVPCFIKAVQLLRREEPVLRERIVFTLGLYCGHMKSARMIESFAMQMGAEPERIERAEFRVKDPCRPANWYRTEVTLSDGSTRAEDWWHLVDGDWGSGFFQHSACNFCDDVVAETADISFGDAWVEPWSSDGRGTNVVLVRSALLDAMLREGVAEGRLALAPVDRDFVVATQAAGFRQRREGLSWRLSRAHPPVVKRVAPGSARLTLRRRLIYAMRMSISRWSHRMFALARALRWPGLYVAWGRAVVAMYHALAYSRGRLGRLIDRLERPARGGP